VLKENAGFEANFHLLKYDGRPFFPEEIAGQVLKLKKARYKGKKETVLMEGDDLEYYQPSKYGL
jgi:hypothetical protein